MPSTRAKTKETQTSINPDIKALLEEAESALNELGDEGGEKLAKLRERVKSALSGLNEPVEKIKKSAEEQWDKCEDYLREHPCHALCIGAVLGAAIGLIISARR